MKIRTIPFGYQISQGKIAVQPIEAETVRQIFTLYQTGLGYQEISKHLSRAGVFYHAGVSWNKHMVKRVLENRRYTGQEDWPAVVDRVAFEAVGQRKAQAPNYAQEKRAPVPDSKHRPIPRYAPTPPIRRMEKEIDRALERQPDSSVKTLILRCAAEKYHTLEGAGA